MGWGGSEKQTLDYKICFLSVAILAQKSLLPLPTPTPTPTLDYDTAMARKPTGAELSRIAIESMGNRIDVLEAEVAEAWAAGATLAANTLAATAAMEVAQAATAAAKAEAADWKRMYDELLDTMPPRKKR